ncbi:MAG: transcriptional regulator [Methylobacterium sp.]|nr:MAG: transcriptional regulator [Methylobacterium sp.]
MDALLAAYAAGGLPKALHALVGSHLELRPESRIYVHALETALASSVDDSEPVTVKNRRDRLEQIFAAAPVMPAEASDSTAEDALDEPRALRHFLGKSIDELEFRTVLPGVKEFRVETDDGTTAILYRIRGGKKMPQHTHEGSEVTLVIRGAFRDETGYFGRGAVAITDEDVDHTPVAVEGEECLCFAVMDAPVRLTGPIGKYLNRFIRH